MAPLARTFTYRGVTALLRPPEPLAGAREGLAVPSLDVQASGGWFSAAVATAPMASRSLEVVFHLPTRAELAALRTFLDAREGRRVGFWLPTFTADAEVSANPTVDAFTFRAWGYPDLFAAHARAYRHWIAYGPGSATYRWWTIGAAVANGDGTETATRGSGTTTGGTAPSAGLTSAAGYRFSLLQFTRLADDTVAVEYLGPRASRVVLSVLTIPQETP